MTNKEIQALVAKSVAEAVAKVTAAKDKEIAAIKGAKAVKVPECQISRKGDTLLIAVPIRETTTKAGNVSLAYEKWSHAEVKGSIGYDGEVSICINAIVKKA